MENDINFNMTAPSVLVDKPGTDQPQSTPLPGAGEINSSSSPEAVAKVLLEEPVSAPAPNYNISLFMDDNFFREHPDKILGEPFQASGRFGQVTKYRGGMSALDRIDVPMDFMANEKTIEDPLLSTGSADINLAASVMQPAAADFLAQVNEISARQSEQVREKGRRKKEAVTLDSDLLTTETPELNTFEDIYRLHNPEISRDELEVFIWYKTSVNKPLSRRWVNLLSEQYYNNLNDPARYEVSIEKIKGWMETGLLFYFNDKHLPGFLYLSGDIYAKKAQLERDRDIIVSDYGQAVYDNQEKALNEVFRRKYEARLLVGTPGADDNLIILPISKFAETFMIDSLESMAEGEPFKIKKVSAQANKNYGRPDFLKDQEASQWKKTEFSQLSLKDGYAYWLIKTGPEIRENVTAQDIIKYYLEGSPIRGSLGEFASKDEVAREKALQLKFKASLQKEGERLFKVFLDQELTLNDKVRLETTWNAKFNNYVPIDYNKIPVAFTMCKYYKGKPEELRPEKREAVAFVLSSGTGCLAYDVGVGKTASAIFTVSAFLDAGYTKRPFICVPNQVYKQFIQEIKDFAPHIPVIEAYNLGEGYIENMVDAQGNIARVAEGCITVMTYEGLEQIGFNDATYHDLIGQLYNILDQGGESERKESQRQKESFGERLATILGKGLRGSLYNIEDFGFDFACYDEAHKLKKVFTAVKGEAETDEKGKTTRGRNPYVINSGAPSNIGLKAFMLNQYILKHNDYQNILLLTATPFTNSPLEIFSMLAMLAYEQLQETDLNNIKNFFDTYIQTSTELVINTKLKPEFRQVITGFNNLVSMQTLIRRYINYKTGEDVNVQRPNKYVLPYTHKLVGGTVLSLSEEEKVETYLPMTAQQRAMMDDIVLYAEGGLSLSALGMAALREVEVAPVDEQEGVMEGEGEEVSEDAMDDDEKKGVRILRALALARNLALSPYLYEYSGLGRPDFFLYIESSPKLKYICECIRSVKKYHEAKGEPVSGQIIYMDRGIEYFGLIREYLIQEVGYKPHEVGIIKSGMPAGVKKGSKEYVKNLFNGLVYNADTKNFDRVSDEERMKIIIGSSTIKEGMNLQAETSTMYDAWLDWNPTDFLQLQGRFWRQGNLFNSIRVVLPLVVDSMDIFIFQKLQEKTQRLNTIWSSDGRKNALRLEEFDPSELKNALIRDPRTVAQLKVIDQGAAIDSEILGIKRLSERIDRIKEQVEKINMYFDDLAESVSQYRVFKGTSDKMKDAQTLVTLMQDVLKKQTDKEGKRMVETYERRNAYGKDVENMSELSTARKPYWFNDFNLDQRTLAREIRDFIKPNGIKFDLDNATGLDRFREQKEGTIKELEEQKAKLNGEENMQAIVDEVIRERAEKKITFKPTGEVVNAFSRLNYLLSDKKIKGVPKVPIFETCPPRENGELATSEAAIEYLEDYLQRQPQTRNLYRDQETGAYKPERAAIHDKIIDELFQGVRCIKQNKPIAVFTGGAPGSGKSHYLKEHAEYLLSPAVFHLDADDIRAMLPEYEGWNSNIVHNESQDIVNRLLSKIGEGPCRYDFIYDGTMNKAQKYFSLIKRAKDMGYETFIIFMEVPYGVARARVLDRYKRTGRYVPMAILDEFFEKMPDGKTRGKDALDQLKAIVDGYVVVDGQTGKVVERGGKHLQTERSYGEFLYDRQAAPTQPPALPPAQSLPVIEEIVPEPAPQEPSGPVMGKKELAQEYIRNLTISVKYLEGEKKKKARDLINALKISIKYL